MHAPNSADPLARVSDLEVRIDGELVGHLVQPSRRSPVVFEYAASWLADGYSISPFSLPLEPGVSEAPVRAAGALHGVFEDSLPDDWGRLLVNRMLDRIGADLATVTPLARLAIVGSTGMGALEYSPAVELQALSSGLGFDELFEQARKLLETDATVALDDLYRQGGSSGGARPKVMVEIEDDPWLVKFPASSDGLDSGVEEYRYAQAASRCGIVMPDTRLVPSELCGGYFAARRFDRVKAPDGTWRKVHMASAAALLEADPFDDAVDYRDLMRLSSALTRDARDAEQLFLVMCFNVFAGNCDDHIRNFSFLCDRAGKWRLSPAYDLTPNPGFFGEHSVLVNGKGSGISDADLVDVGQVGGVSTRRAKELIAHVRSVVSEDLGCVR